MGNGVVSATFKQPLRKWQHSQVSGQVRLRGYDAVGWAMLWFWSILQQCFHLMDFGVGSAVFQQSTVFV